MEINRIYFGDCIQILTKEISVESINLVFADPPYNLSGNGLKWIGNRTGGDWYMVNEDWDKMPVEDYTKFTHDWISACKTTLIPSGSIYVSCTYHNLAEVMAAMKFNSLKINNVIVWQKTNAMPNMTKRLFTHSTEFIVWGVKGKNWTFNYEELKLINSERQKDGSLKQMRDVWRIPLVQGKERLRGQDGRALHPSQKPEELLRRILVASSNPGDIVLDPFLGSGTTAVVAQKLGRNWIGIERDEKYRRFAQNRIDSLTQGINLQ